VSGDNPKKTASGFAIKVAKEPLIEKTNIMAIIDQLLLIFQRFFKFSIKIILLFLFF